MPRLTARPRQDGRKEARREARPDARPRRPHLSPRLKWALRLSAGGLVLIALAGAGVLAWATGWLDRRVAAIETAVTDLTVAAGFRVEEVLVTGRRASDPAALLAALGTERGDPILAVDLGAGRAALLALPWVEEASIRRRLPDTLLIRMEERRPLALWQNARRLHLLDTAGAVVPVDDLSPYRTLPLVVGPDAPGHARALLAVLETVPGLAARVSAAVRVGERRWDLHLDNGVRVHLPEEEIGPALRRLADMQQQADLIDRDIRAIDLRLGDRVVIRQAPAAAERRRLPGENT
ncbi:MAG: FtsQ-type POTRA domain-containing protein [Alphaproteobacteria bacterium]|jgi:cell division protein FtsQ|nr:FtsQ-type POTRA domain-containing protein [Alphaproteobacteria bacterium]